MIIISHRGLWNKLDEKNQIVAFKNSFNSGFGTETDIRDYNEDLVISHDIATKKSVSFNEFIEIYKKVNDNLPLALNVKADGLQNILQNYLKKYKIEKYFCFDMSVPDMILYIKNELKIFTRQSEYEKKPMFYEESIGIWMDSFYKDWICEKDIEEHLNNNKQVCIVSPDLHKRNYIKIWEKYKKMNCIKSEKIILCTDHPEEAKNYFYE